MRHVPVPFFSRFSRGAPGESSSVGAASLAPAAPSSPTAPSGAVVQRIIDAVDALIVVATADGNLWLWNQRCDETSGVPLSEVAGQSVWRVMRLRPNFRVVAQDALDQLISGKQRNVEFQAQWLRKDGRKARVSWNAQMADIGGTRLVVATGVETTRGRKAAREIAETESRFETLLEVLPDPVVIHQDGRTVFVNRAALELYGAKTAEDMSARMLMDFVAPESRPLVAARVGRMLNQGEQVPLVEERHMRLDGTVFDVEVVAAPVTFDGRPAVEVVARNITARKETEAALRASSSLSRIYS